MIEYHANNGNVSDPIFSHSGYNKLEQHPQEFVKYITTEEKYSTPSMTRGDLLHAWLQHKDSFIIADVDKPSGKLGEFMEAFYALYNKKGYNTNHTFSHYCKQDYSVEMECFTKYRDIFISINKRVPQEDELKLLIYALRFAREEAEFGGKPGAKGARTENTIIENFKETLPYINFLDRAEGKIGMTKTDRDIITNCHESLRKHPLANKLLFELDGLVEHEMFWEENIDGILIKRKAKADKLIVDRENKILTVIDPKTTATKVADFVRRDLSSPFYFYKYGRQLESYADAWFKTNPDIDRSEWKTQLFSIPVQTIDPFITTVYLIGEEESNYYYRSLREVDQRAAFHIKTGNWNLTMEEQQNGGYVKI